MYYCKQCLDPKSQTKTNREKVQCDKCLFVGSLVKIYNLDDECIICYSCNPCKKVLTCNHWICWTCFYSILNKICPICKLKIEGAIDVRKDENKTKSIERNKNYFRRDISLYF